MIIRVGMPKNMTKYRIAIQKNADDKSKSAFRSILLYDEDEVVSIDDLVKVVADAVTTYVKSKGKEVNQL